MIMSARWGIKVLVLILILAGAACGLNPAEQGREGTSRDPGSATLSEERVSFEEPTEEQSLVTVRASRMTLSVHGRPLGWVLNEISRQSGVAIMNAGNASNQPVSLELQGVPLEQGLREILKDYDTVFSYGAEEKREGEGKEPQAPLRAVWIYPKGRGGRLTPVPPEPGASTSDQEKGLTSPKATERAQAVELMVEQEGDEALDKVLEALKDRDAEVRRRALQAILDSGLPLATALLEGLVQHDPSPTVRSMALEALASGSGDPPVPDSHLRTVAGLALNDPSPDVREQAREIIEQLEPPAQPLEPEEEGGASAMPR
jgi:hypothetical protein